MRQLSRTALASAVALALAQRVIAQTELPVRICTHTRGQLESCEQLIELPAFKNETCRDLGPPQGRICLKHQCIIAQDCNSQVANGEADWGVADPMMLYFMDREWGGGPKEVDPFAKEVRGNAPVRSKGTGSGEGADYKSVAIIRADMCQEHNFKFTLSDARGLRSCHTRYGDLAGWAFPVYDLASRGISEGPDDVSVVTNFFGASCAPGNGGKGICTGCANPNACDLNDAFAGGQGVLDCVRTGQGDVGFLDSYTALGSGLEGPTGADNAEAFRILCNDGCKTLDHYHRDGCFMGVVPPDVAYARVDNPNVVHFQRTLLEASGDPSFYNLFGLGNLKDPMFSDFTKTLETVTVNADDYLGSLKEVLDDFQNQRDQQIAESRTEHIEATQDVDKKADVEDTKVRDPNASDTPQPRVSAAAPPAPPPAATKSGFSAGAIAGTFFGGLILGVAAIIVAVKLHKRRNVDQFYAGDMDIANGGFPGADSRTRGAGDPDSPFHVDLPENNLPSTPPAMRG